MKSNLNRRRLLQAALGGSVVSVAGRFAAALPFFAQSAASMAAGDDKRVLLVLELSGGNDGLSTVVPYADDAYHQLRPKIALRDKQVLKIDERYGFSTGMKGFEKLYKDGKLAIVHGCGYDQPSFSHFTSMAYWHTAAPNSGEAHGWVGRLADTLKPDGADNFIVNIDEAQSLAVASRRHTPVVFDNPDRFARKGHHQQFSMFDQVADASAASSSAHKYLLDVARSAQDASQLVRDAWANYRTPIDYGIYPMDLNKVAALIHAGMPTRLYYAAYRHNAFDTHVHQADLHKRIITYVSDAVYGFMRDMERIGRGDDVSVLIFSEFGRRAAENTSLGTDHGTAGPMFVVGKAVKGGHYGEPCSLTKLMPDGNLVFTTDFRRVYATVAEQWMGVTDSSALLKHKFETFPIFS